MHSDEGGGAVEIDEAATAARASAHVVLPIPPSVNRCWRNVPGVGRVRTAHYRAWRDAAGWELRAQRPPQIPGDVSISIRAGRPRRRRDLDNIIKPVLDILVSCGVIVDDSHVVALMAVWDSAVADDSVRVLIQQRGRRT